MSKGTPLVSFRLPLDLRGDMECAIASANETRREEEYTVSSWIVEAIKAKLAHIRRSKELRRKKAKANRDARLASGINAAQ